MPCDQVRTVSLDLSVAKWDLLVEAAKKVGHDVRAYGQSISGYIQDTYSVFRVESGRVIVEQGQESFVNTLKQAYAKEAVRTVADRFKWSVKEHQNQFVLQKRF
jgi:hypothetical protein